MCSSLSGFFQNVYMVFIEREMFWIIYICYKLVSVSFAIDAIALYLCYSRLYGTRWQVQYRYSLLAFETVLTNFIGKFLELETVERLRCSLYGNYNQSSSKKLPKWLV